MSFVNDGPFLPKEPSLSEIILNSGILSLDPANFELQQDTEVKKHPSSGTHQGLDLDYKSLVEPVKKPESKSLSFADTFATDIMIDIPASYHEMIKHLFAPSPEERLNRELAEASSQLPGAGQWARCPDCRAIAGLHSVIAHLNDDHKWDRNRIADWLDELADAGRINIDF